MAQVAIPLIIGLAGTVASYSVQRGAQKDAMRRAEGLSAGPDPGDALTPDEAALQRRLRLRRSREALVIEPHAQQPSTGLQIPT